MSRSCHARRLVDRSCKDDLIRPAASCGSVGATGISEGEPEKKLSKALGRCRVVRRHERGYSAAKFIRSMSSLPWNRPKLGSILMRSFASGANVRFVLILAVCVTAWSTSAGAQGSAAAPPAQQDDPVKPARDGRNVTSTGQTKPPGEPVGPGLGTSSKLEKQHEEIDRHTLKSIYRGALGCQ